MTFDEESELLYGAVAPRRSPTDYEPVLAELDSLLPGSGDLTSRYTAYVDRFLVPPDKIAVALDAAIADAPSPRSTCRPTRASTSPTSAIGHG